jgi:hypothetical protein
MNEHVDYQAQTPSAITKFFWWCAGADKQILKYSSYSDHVKYFGIGGVVFATAVLAFLSMGFAMHIIFNGNWYVTIPVSIVWALIILNLDRFIVSSTGKGDGKETMGLMELVNALPRLGMAVLIGFCISAPLETYIFQTEIQREWQLSMDQLALSKSYEVLQAENKHQSEKIDEYEQKKKEVKDQEIIYQKANDEVNKEMNGESGRGGDGPETRKKEKIRDIELKKLDDLRAQLAILESGRSSNKDKIKRLQDSTMKETKALRPGFLDQIMMLERLSSNGKSVPKFDPATNQIIKGKEIEIFGAAFWPIWLVRLLFMMLEIAPVLLKLMLIKGPYDYMSENINQILESKQGISIEHIRNEHNKITKFKTNHNPLRIIKIVERQNQRETENAIEAIDSFAEKEKKDIQENPEKYIKDNDVDKV